METITKSWNLSTINRRKNKINPQPQYQRTEVWSESKKQLLMDTILRGYDIPKVYLKESEEENFEHEVIDGQQRLRAIWEFFNNEYPLGNYSKDLPIGDVSGQKYSDLMNDILDTFELYELSIIIIKDASQEEVRDLFLRLQEGVTLNPPEKRNAMIGNMRDFISELASHKVFQIIPKDNKRFLYADWIAHIVCLELAKGPTDVKADNLKKMYENNKNFNKNSSDAKKIKRILNYIQSSFEGKTPEMNIKWGFVDFYLLISLLVEMFVINNRNTEFGSFYVGFEKERREVDDPIELIEIKKDSWSKDLYEYIDAFNKSGGVKKNIETRNQVYTRKIYKEIIDLVPKDNNRFFNQNQKVVIWRKNNGQCVTCGCKIEFTEMHADHIEPHSKGGKTTIENGQTLCAKCNQKKGSRSEENI